MKYKSPSWPGQMSALFRIDSASDAAKNLAIWDFKLIMRGVQAIMIVSIRAHMFLDSASQIPRAMCPIRFIIFFYSFSILAVWNNNKKRTLIYWEMHANKKKYEITLKHFKYTWNNTETVQLHKRSQSCHVFLGRASFDFFLCGSLLFWMVFSLVRLNFRGLRFFLVSAGGSFSFSWHSEAQCPRFLQI